MSPPVRTQTRVAPAYEEFYGFGQSPFTLTPDPRFFYRSESHDEAIRLLLQAIRRREGFIVLTGDIGTGKTTISRALLQQLDGRTFTSLVLNPFLSVEELLREVLMDFGVVSRDAVRTGRLATASKHELISTLQEFLLSLVPIKGSAVLIIDEAQHLSPQALEEIRILSNFETNETKLLQIVLVGQLELLNLLANAEMRGLHQRISIRATLKPLGRDEVQEYIEHRMRVAEGADVTFAAAAIDRVHQFTGGVPRLINLLCDRALMVAAGAEAHRITPEIIEDAAEKLALAPLIEVPVPVRRRRLWPWIAAAFAVGFAGALLWLALAGSELIDATPPPAPPRPVLGAPAPARPHDIPTDDFLLPPPPKPPAPAPVGDEPAAA